MSESTENISIQLGDIIEIIAPSDPALNNHTFYIKRNIIMPLNIKKL